MQSDLYKIQALGGRGGRLSPFSSVFCLEWLDRTTPNVAEAWVGGQSGGRLDDNVSEAWVVPGMVTPRLGCRLVDEGELITLSVFGTIGPSVFTGDVLGDIW